MKLHEIIDKNIGNIVFITGLIGCSTIAGIVCDKYRINHSSPEMFGVQTNYIPNEYKIPMMDKPYLVKTNEVRR